MRVFIKTHKPDQPNKQDFDATYSRVIRQMNNLGEVNPIEAFELCMAHTRCFGQVIAQMSQSDEEFATKLGELFALLHSEGIAVRQHIAEHGHEHS